MSFSNLALLAGGMLFLFWLFMPGGGPADPHRMYVRGDLGAGLEALRRRATSNNVEGWEVNIAVCLLVAAGRYAEALAWTRRVIATTESFDPLIVTNGAEAAYNLGAWDEAEALLKRLDGVEMLPVAKTGLALQRAWIAAHGGRGQLALELVDSCTADSLPFEYRSEWHYTRATALQALSRFDEAAAAVTAGAELAHRASSRRNAWSLAGQVALAAGNADAAERLLRKAADSGYRWQGGDGLLALAQVLRQTDRHDESQEMLRRVIVQDPESESAAKAAQLLGISPPAAFAPFFAPDEAAALEGSGK